MRLSQKFLSKYRYRETTPMTPLGEFVYYRTYSRFLPEKGRREYWWETCRRAVEYNCSIVDTSEEEAEKLFDNMYNLKQFLAGRTLWVGDTKSAKKFPMSNFNCFRRNTEFITRYGIKSFNDFEDGDEVDVLSSTGGWKTATVKNFGSRNLSKLTVRRGKRLDTIYVTDNHRWYVRKHKSEKRFVVKTTGELNKGDILRDKRRYEQTNIIPCNIGIQHGIVFGDGTYDKKMNHCRIHLVDEKQELSKFFTTGSQCTAGKYNQTVVYGLPNNWKQLPSLDSNVEYLMGFIMGLFSTDGSYCGSNISISNSDENILKHIKSILSIIGLDCGEISLNREISPFDESYSPSYRLNIYSYYIPELFFIRDKHIEEYKKHQPKELSWVVEEIIPTDLVEDVWCVVEPDTESFTLSNNILTKNCSFLKIDSIKSYCDMFYLLMLGSGVGFRTFKEDVDKLPKFRKNITLTHKPYTPIKKEDRQEDTTYSENRYFAELVVGDSKEGWVDALRIFLEIFSLDAKKRYKQLIINYNNVRPRGERLKTFGGTASGHESLMLMLNKIYQLFRSKKTDDFKLTTLDCLDIANMLAENVVSGGVRRCLPEDTLVHTKNGLVKIKDINIGDLVSTSKGYHPVTAKTYQGFQDTIKIKTQLGTLECTENHKIAVIDDVYNNYIWKKASELKYGDRVIFVKNYLEGIDTELPEFKYENPPHSTTCKDIKIPKLDEDTAYLLGYFHGDGYVRLTNNSGEISLAVDSRHISIKNKLCDILTRFNVNVGIQEPKEEDKCFKIRIKSKQLAEYFSKFKTPNSEIEIPDFILRGNSSVRVSYVSGLTDADGSFRNSTYTIVSSVYPKFIKQVQVLMSSFGVASYIVSRKRNNLNWKDIHTLKVKGRDFTDCYIKLFKDKCLKFEKPHNNSISYYSYGYPKEMVMEENFKGLCKYWDKKCNQITVETLNRFMNRDSNIVPIEVISVGEGNRDVDTYDISVDSVEEFVCDSGYLVHNSSQINLSEIEDKSIRDAKTNLFTQDENGNWILDEKLSHRMKSNNSIGFRKKPTREELEEIFKSIRYSGEPGFINIEEAKRRFTSFTGTNPCGEILLPNNGLCNLVTVNVYGFVEDGKLNKKELLEAFELNTRAAYRMTCLTLELEHWDRVQKEHRLIGCSMTGWQDAMSVLNYDMGQQSDLLKEIKDTVKHAVREYAIMLGTKECKLATTIKPEGTLSLLPTVSPGVHHSYSPYYIRRIRISSDDPLLKVCEDLGLTVLNEVGQDDKTCNTKVVEFYVKSPTDKTRNDVSAIEQLETYKMFMENYVEHNASNTITVKRNEWREVIDWVYDNWDCIVGVTFLSIDDNYYPLMPYESITEDEYKAGYKNITITPELISKYENVQVEELEIGSDDECSSGGSCPIR